MFVIHIRLEYASINHEIMITSAFWFNPIQHLYHKFFFEKASIFLCFHVKKLMLILHISKENCSVECQSPVLMYRASTQVMIDSMMLLCVQLSCKLWVYIVNIHLYIARF